MDQKQSQFTEVSELIDSDYIPIFGAGTNRKISKPNLLSQIKDETDIFIYPTIAQLQAAALVADLTWPIYVRVAETGYKLYKITSLAANAYDISLSNGTTASLQLETAQVSVAATFAMLGLLPATAGQIITISCHTSGTLGGGQFIGVAGSAASDGGTQINSATAGIYWKRINYTFITPEMFGALCDGTTNDYNAFSLANTYLANTGGGGGRIQCSAGRYRLTQMFVLGTGVQLFGVGFQRPNATASWEGTTSIFGDHAQDAVISLRGAIGCTVQDLTIETLTGNRPKVGLLLGRSSAASAGYHCMRRISVFGYYNAAAYYSIASEDNLWEDVACWIFGGTAKYCLYTGISNALSVGTLTTSSNLDNTFLHPFFINSSTDANAACIYIEGAQAVGSWNFIGAYLTAYAGSYVEIANGNVDGLAMLGPINFNGVDGEILSGGDPLYGIKISGAASINAPGLTIGPARFAFNAGTNHFNIFKAPNLTLINPMIMMQPPEASPFALTDLDRAKVLGGIVSIGRNYTWTAVSFTAPWANTYGAPYAPAGYMIDQTNKVRLRGTVTGVGVSAIFTLPTTHRPAVNMFFSVYAGGAVGRVLITAATGVVSLTVGTATEVDLNGISFDYYA